jgi:hypothetical protein
VSYYTLHPTYMHYISVDRPRCQPGLRKKADFCLYAAVQISAGRQARARSTSSPGEPAAVWRSTELNTHRDRKNGSNGRQVLAADHSPPAVRRGACCCHLLLGRDNGVVVLSQSVLPSMEADVEGAHTTELRPELRVVAATAA